MLVRFTRLSARDFVHIDLGPSHAQTRPRGNRPRGHNPFCQDRAGIVQADICLFRAVQGNEGAKT